MKESDINYGLDKFIERNTQQWGIRLGFPDEEIIMPIGLEIDTDIAIIHGVNPYPPINRKGERALRSKKVKVVETELPIRGEYNGNGKKL